MIEKTKLILEDEDSYQLKDGIIYCEGKAIMSFKKNDLTPENSRMIPEIYFKTSTMLNIRNYIMSKEYQTDHETIEDNFAKVNFDDNIKSYNFQNKFSNEYLKNGFYNVGGVNNFFKDKKDDFNELANILKAKYKKCKLAGYNSDDTLVLLIKFCLPYNTTGLTKLDSSSFCIASPSCIILAYFYIQCDIFNLEIN